MTATMRRLVVSSLAAALLVGASPALALAPAGNSGPAADQSALQKFPYLATVSGDDVWVRCGAGFDYYPTGKVGAGQIVRVVGEQGAFSRVQLTGPAFREFFGYVKYPKVETARFRLEPEGKAGLTLGRMDLVAPNAQEKNDPAQSWKSLVRLEPETTVIVLETFTTPAETVHKVALPPGAEGWISTSLLRPASADEQATWNTAADESAKVATSNKPAPSVTAGKPAPTTETHAAKAKPSAEEAMAAPKSPERPTVLARDEPQAPPPSPANQPGTEPETIETGSPKPTTTIATDKGDVEVPPGSGDIRTREQRQAEQIKALTIEDLDAALTRLKAEDLAAAEIEPLRQQYLGFAQRNPDKKNLAQYASVRAEQLKVWGDTQKQLQAVAEARLRAKMSKRDADAIVRAINTRGDYIAIGRLDASTIYDGQRLPALYRIKDFSTGRTVGYLQKEEEGFDLTTMLGQTIGVVGESDYDNGLRLNVIKPRRIDLLAPPDDGGSVQATGAEPSTVWPTRSPTPGAAPPLDSPEARPAETTTPRPSVPEPEKP